MFWRSWESNPEPPIAAINWGFRLAVFMTPVLIVVVIVFLILAIRRRRAKPTAGTQEVEKSIESTVKPDKTTMFCINCGAPIPRDSKFCKECGTKQP